MSNLLARLIEAGTPADLISEVAMLLAERKVLENRRKNERERKAKSRRDSDECHVTSREGTGQDGTTEDSPLSRPPNDNNSNPPTHTPVNKPRARKADFVLPSNIPAEAWDGWLEMRKKIGKPPTDHAKTLAVAELDKLAADGWPPGDVLNHCTLNAYQGIFPPKDRKNANRNSSTTGNRSPDGWGTVLREVGGREAGYSSP